MEIKGFKKENENMTSEKRYKQHMTTQRPVSKKLEEKTCAKINLNFRGSNISHSIKTVAAVQNKDI